MFMVNIMVLAGKAGETGILPAIDSQNVYGKHFGSRVVLCFGTLVASSVVRMFMVNILVLAEENSFLFYMLHQYLHVNREQCPCMRQIYPGVLWIIGIKNRYGKGFTSLRRLW